MIHIVPVVDFSLPVLVTGDPVCPVSFFSIVVSLDVVSITVIVLVSVLFIFLLLTCMDPNREFLCS